MTHFYQIFCIDTRDTELVETYESYIKTTIYSLRNSTRPKANIYWCDKFGNNGSDLWNSDENKDVNLYYKDSSVEFDPTSAVTTGLNLRGLDLDLETYVFIVFDATEVESSNLSANLLLEKIEETNKENTNLHISVISDSETYIDTAFLPEIIESTQGTIIAPWSADEVSADVLEYLGAEEVVKIISSTGLQIVSPKFDKEYIKSLTNTENRRIDTDYDGLADCIEIALDSGLIDLTQPDDFLPTIQDCIDHLTNTGEYTYILGGYSEIWTNSDETEERKDNERLPAKVIMRTRILPLNSDPTSEDGDEDGILDIDEFEWNGIDELYKDVSPLKADTVESIYHKLANYGYSNSMYNPIYLDIRGNHIKINIRYHFNTEETDRDGIKLYNFDNSVSNLTNEEQSDNSSKIKITKEELLEGVSKVWSQSYDIPNEETSDKVILDYFKGKLYDFYPGMKITVELNFIEQEKDSIMINVYEKNEDGTSKVTNLIQDYKNHSDSIIQISIRDNYNYPKSIEEISYVFAHELGHTMGIKDAYGKITYNSTVNDGYSIYSEYDDPNLEFPKKALTKNNATITNAFNAGELMDTKGQPCSNDLEMILQAFIENRMQYFYADDQRNKEGVYLSKAIKNPIIVYKKYVYSIGKDIYRIWNKNTGEWMVKYSVAEMEKYVEENI